MTNTKRWSGVGLVVAGAAVGVFAARRPVRPDAGAQGPDPAVAAAAAAAQRLAAEQGFTEEKASHAAALKPLNAALDSHVDGPTLLDLFDSEDWWQPYREEFVLARVIVGDSILASRGKLELGTLDGAVVKAARKQRVASALIKIGAQSYLVAAARLPAMPEREPVLVLARVAPAALTAPVAVAAAPALAPARLTDRPLPLVAAGALCLLGLVLLVSGRGKRGGAAASGGGVTAAVMREPTLRFGTPARPQPQHRSEVQPGVTPPLRPPVASGDSVSIPGNSGSAPATIPSMAPVAAAANAGALRTFGRYHLLDRLGEGGMSEIFTAETSGVEGFKRIFVLKRLRPELARDKEAVAQFIDEARLQAGLVHSNIVPVFDFGMVSGEYFMTQEYILGRDLVRLVSRHQQQTGHGLEPRLAYYIAYETLQALGYAHSKRDKDGSEMGIVHRDISAGNVLVSLQGEVKLSDFGIVKSNRRVTRTQVGMVKGNANFMSPEQARGLHVDGRSDLFSMALVLYYCLTNQLLYGGDNDLDVLYKAATGPTVDDYRRFHDLPEPAGSVLEKALAFDPRERFQTADEFADVLAAHIGGGKAQAATLMQLLFGDELRKEAA